VTDGDSSDPCCTALDDNPAAGILAILAILAGVIGRILSLVRGRDSGDPERDPGDRVAICRAGSDATLVKLRVYGDAE
jgi:hypothetical protein